jgi:hypothetical protein
MACLIVERFFENSLETSRWFQSPCRQLEGSQLLVDAALDRLNELSFKGRGYRRRLAAAGEQ